MRSGRSVVSRQSRSIGSANTEAWADAGSGRARWITNAIAGATATMIKGKASASVSTPAASRRVSATRGEDSSMTGNSVKADMDQSDTSRSPANGAIKAGASSPAQNATAARRRGGEDGHAMSLTAAAFGRAVANTINSDSAT